MRITENSRENKYKKESNRLKEKFETLRGKDTNNEHRESTLKHEVYDLTTEGIDEDVKSYLKLGPDFSETPRRLPYEKIIIETERMCKVIEEEKETKPQQAAELERETHKLREEVKHLLRKQRKKKIKSNLTQQESIGRKKAYQDKERVYIPADKGKVMVAMEKNRGKRRREQLSVQNEESFERHESQTINKSKQRLGSYGKDIKRRTRNSEGNGNEWRDNASIWKTAETQ